MSKLNYYNIFIFILFFNNKIFKNKFFFYNIKKYEKIKKFKKPKFAVLDKAPWILDLQEFYIEYQFPYLS